MNMFYNAHGINFYPYSAMLNNPICYADPLGDSAIKPGHIFLGSSGLQPNDEKQKTIQARLTSMNAQYAKNSDPVISTTIAVTERTYGGSVELAGITLGGVMSINERDLTGLRNNQLTDNGKTKDGKVEVRDGMALNFGGVGGETSYETGQQVTTSKISVPFASAVSKKDKAGKEIYKGTEIAVGSLKVGLHYGVEVGITVNIPNVLNAAQLPSKTNVSESTQIRIFNPGFIPPR